jgi:hypothetical protein
MIAFVVASSLSVSATETVLAAKLDFKLGSKIGTVIDRKLLTLEIFDIKLGSKLGSKLGTGRDRELCTAVLDIKLVSKLGTVHG